MYVAIAYDIREDRRRERFVRLLEGFGERVQYSVFECDLKRRQFDRLLVRIARFIEADDAVRVYRFPKPTEEYMLVLRGVGKVKTPSFIIF